MARYSCAHCGLPVTAPRSGEGAELYCCLGCAIASRIVGRGDDSSRSWTILRLGIGAFLAMNVMMISLLLYTGALEPQSAPFFRWTLLGLSTPAMAIVGYTFAQGAIAEIRRGRLSLDTLIAVGCFTAYTLSAANTIAGSGYIYYDTATMLPVLVTLGKLIEATAKGRAGRLVKGLATLLPAAAIRLEDSGPREIAFDEVRPGDRLRVLPGQRFAADGIILEGATTIDQAAFTGESRPRARGVGDTVIAGTVNGEGSLVIRAEAVGEKLLLRRIIEMADQARREPSATQRIAERAASVLIAAVLVFAAGAGTIWLWTAGVRQAGFVVLSILAVTCPCAMGIAAPLATSLAIARAAAAGVLVRGGDVLERAGLLRTILFDKTGTVTLGRPVVRAVIPAQSAAGWRGRGAGGVTCDELLGVLASLESASEHALAKAVVSQARRQGLPTGSVRDVAVAPGQGIRGCVTWAGCARQVVAGTRAFVAAATDAQDAAPAADAPATRAEAPESISRMYVAWDGAFRGHVVLGDAPRDGAAETIAALSAMGVRTALLSGDDEAPAQAVADSLGIGIVLAPRLPHEKIAELRACGQAGGVTGMVGDGINDAPALAAADVGIALGAGTDLARQAGGIVLLADQLAHIPWLISLGRRTRRIIRQNLWWAIGYNAVALAAAGAGVLHPLVAAVAMAASSLTVLGNSMRLQRFAGPVSQTAGHTAANTADAQGGRCDP